MNRPIGIFGASGMAREVADITQEFEFNPIFITTNQKEIKEWKFSDLIILESDIAKYGKIPLLIGIANSKIRKNISESFTFSQFINIIHPQSSLGRGQKDLLSKKAGIIIGAGVRISNNIEIGNFTIINPNSTIGHDTVIEEYVTIAPSACISGNVHIKKNCWIGAGSVINQGIHNQKIIIGENTVIGSGSVVTRSCDPNSTYVGIPARKIK